MGNKAREKKKRGKKIVNSGIVGVRVYVWDEKRGEGRGRGRGRVVRPREEL